MVDQRADTVLKLARNRVLAHQVLFQHRHPDATPDFHTEIINIWHDRATLKALFMAFREAGKSTIAEEAITIMALLRSFKNAVIIGENQERAIDRITAIKHELKTNEFINQLFGEQEGETWGVAKIILRNGVILQALGRGQEVRGMKHLDMRPDLCFGDDLEGKEHVRDPAARKETLRWFFAEVLPALDKNARIRVQATPLDRESLPMTLRTLSDWTSRVYPIKHRDPEKGTWRSTWPSRYPLAWIDAKETELHKLGLHHEFQREYMCQAEDPSKKVFTEAMFKVEPRVHVWQPAFAFYDPARTVNERSAFTGWAVWSWIGNRLVVWDGGGDAWLPDKTIDHMFEVDNQFRPVWIGVEEDGLNEFVLQPLRHEMTRRGHLLPIKAEKAPKGKLDFIGGLQPFFLAGEITFAKELPELKRQFLGFPTGQIDGPNALAYAPRLRPGQVIYEDFASVHVVEQVLIWERVPVWLCLNATQSMTTGVLAQLCDGALHVIADWVQEGDPGSQIKNIVEYAQTEAGGPVRCTAGSVHFAAYDIVGLSGAVAALPAKLHRAGDVLGGRDELRRLFGQQVKGRPAVQIGHAARWTINGLSSGYAREVTKLGVVKNEARDGIYKVLIEGLEAFAGLLKTGTMDDDQHANWATTSSGHRYKSILPGRQEDNPDAKANWIGAVNSTRRFR